MNALTRYLRAKALEKTHGEPLPSPDAAVGLSPIPIREGTYKWRNKENRQRQMRELMRKRRAHAKQKSETA